MSEPPRAANLVQRVRGILLRPSAEWDVIDVEPATTQGIFTGYVMILAAVWPLCSAVGAMVFGIGIPGVAVFRPSPLGLIVSAVVSYGLSLVMTYVSALVIDALAPSFDGTRDRLKALKVAAYGYTAAWLAGVFTLVPLLTIFAIMGLYSLYLIYVGLPKLMRAPKEKALGYTAVVILLLIVFAAVISLVTAPLRMLGAGVPGTVTTTTTTIGSTGDRVTVGGTTMNLAALASAGRAAEAQAAAVHTTTAADGTTSVTVTGGAQAASPDALKAMLPASVAGYSRGEVSAESVGAAGANTSHAQAEYAKGDARITVEVADTGGLAALGGLAAAMGVNSEKQTATGYEKVSTGGGRMVTESYDRAARSGKYSVMQGRGMVSAEGSGGASMDDLKAAVAAVDPGRVAGAAKG